MRVRPRLYRLQSAAAIFLFDASADEQSYHSASNASNRSESSKAQYVVRIAPSPQPSIEASRALFHPMPTTPCLRPSHLDHAHSPPPGTFPVARDGNNSSVRFPSPYPFFPPCCLGPSTIPNFRPISLASFMLLLRLPRSATSETSFFSARACCSKAALSAGVRRGRRLVRARMERRRG